MRLRDDTYERVMTHVSDCVTTHVIDCNNTGVGDCVMTYLKLDIGTGPMAQDGF